MSDIRLYEFLVLSIGCWCPAHGSYFIFLSSSLFKVFHRGLEHPDVVLTGDVTVQSRPYAFAVAHLAEDTAVGRGDALDSEAGVVGIIMYIGRGTAAEIVVLRRDLAVRGELTDQFLTRQESALAV